jgi:hypothetical protein
MFFAAAGKKTQPRGAENGKMSRCKSRVFPANIFRRSRSSSAQQRKINLSLFEALIEGS